MNKYKAKFIVLEGIDGTGKTTTARQLKQHYESQGKSVKIYYEPYQFSSFNVKDIIQNLEKDKVTVSDFAILNLMIASRDISIKNILIPELEKNDIVIADRYYYSTFAYNIITNKEITFFSDYEDITCTYPRPDKILFFKIKDINNYQNSKSDKFEIQDLTKFKKIQQAYYYTFESEYLFNNLGSLSKIQTIEVNQNKQPYFNFNQVLEALEGI